MRFFISILIIFSGCSFDAYRSSQQGPTTVKSQTEEQKRAVPIIDSEFERAIDVVLRNGSSTEYQRAVTLLKGYFCTKEIREARKLRDATLLSERYPKDSTLNVINGQVYWTAYDRIHFAARHLVEYFDSSTIKSRNSFWPLGTTQEDLDLYLEAIFKEYGKSIELPERGKSGPGFKYYDFMLPGKDIKVRVGIESSGRVSSFFPLSGPGVKTLSGDELEDILEAIGKDT
ncbi:MAG: hypothetical protein RMM17_08555 [Acidobacteriota bacterium]|nr:hypothetical protein [Blastocatellia bacterium]MDW8412718.1 hypothetical protein [Acidobacteriota bacterium]